MEELQSFLKIFGANSWSYIKELADYFSDQNKFYNNMFIKDEDEQWKQLAFYTVFFICFTYVLTGLEIRPIAQKLYIILLFQTTIDLIPIIFTVIFSNKIFKKNFNLKIIIVRYIFFIICTVMFITPFAFFPYYIYLKTQEYEWYFLSNLLIVLLSVYRIIYFGYLLFNNLKQMFTWFLSVVFSYNVIVSAIVIVYSLFSFDTFLSEKWDDLIESDEPYKEWNNVNNLLDESSYRKVPCYKVYYKLDKRTDGNYVYLSDKIKSNKCFDYFDVAISNATMSGELMTKMANNKIVLTKKLDSLKFDRNKQIFKNNLKYYDSYLEEISRKEDTTMALCNIHLGNSSKIVRHIYLYKLKFNLVEMNANLLEQEIEIYKSKYRAEIPLKCFSFAMFGPTLGIIKIVEYFTPSEDLDEKNKQME